MIEVFPQNVSFIAQFSLTLWLFKACFRYFLLDFYFSPNDSPLKTMENVFYFIEKALFVLKISRFLYFCLPLFFPISAIALEVE